MCCSFGHVCTCSQKNHDACRCCGADIGRIPIRDVLCQDCRDGMASHAHTCPICGEKRTDNQYELYICPPCMQAARA